MRTHRETGEAKSIVLVCRLLDCGLCAKLECNHSTSYNKNNIIIIITTQNRDRERESEEREREKKK